MSQVGLVQQRRLPTPVVEKLLNSLLGQQVAIERRLEQSRHKLDATELEVLGREHVRRYLDCLIERDGVFYSVKTILEWVLGVGLPRKKLQWYFTEVEGITYSIDID